MESAVSGPTPFISRSSSRVGIPDLKKLTESWITKHLLGADRDYVEFFKENNCT